MMSEQTMTRRGFVPYGPSGAAVEALARVMIEAESEEAMKRHAKAIADAIRAELGVS